jgi:hypothetical protein
MTQFAVTYRISNTQGYRVFGLFPTIEEARKQAIASGFRAPPTTTTQGKILCWNIEEREGQ